MLIEVVLFSGAVDQLPLKGGDDEVEQAYRGREGHPQRASASLSLRVGVLRGQYAQNGKELPRCCAHYCTSRAKLNDCVSPRGKHHVIDNTFMHVCGKVTTVMNRRAAGG